MTGSLTHAVDRAACPPSLVHGPRFRGRIGADPARGFYPVPHRYEVYVGVAGPDAQRVAVTLGLLGLGESVPTRLLDGASAGAASAEARLRGCYEATSHHYAGPLTVPALVDRWSGRVVSNHTPDILRDLAGRLVDPQDPCAARLRPAGRAGELAVVEGLLEELRAWSTGGADPGGRRCAGPPPAGALDLFAARLRSAPYMLGQALTAADVDAWVALRLLAAAPGAGDLLAAHPGRGHLRSYVARLDSLPAFAAVRAGDPALT